MAWTGLLGGAGWQQLQIIPFVTRNAARQEDGILLCIRVQEFQGVLCVPEGEGVCWHSPEISVHSGCQPCCKVVLVQGSVGAGLETCPSLELNTDTLPIP